MKVKMKLYISRPEAFVKNPNNSSAYSLIDEGATYMDDTWTFVCDVVVDVDVDNGAVIDAARKEIDDEIVKHEVAINVLGNRKSELLAITYVHPEDDTEDDIEWDAAKDGDIASAENHAIDSQEDRTI